MKRSHKKDDNMFWMLVGFSFVFILVGSFLAVQFLPGDATGRAVQTKGITYQKEYTTKETTTQKTLTTKLPQSTQVQKAPLLREEPLSVTPSSETPVQRLPQPAPGDQDSDVELVNQCTTCGKQYEYRMMEGICAGTLDDSWRFEDEGLDLRCIRSDAYNDYRHSDGNYVMNLGAIAKCEDLNAKIVSYGARCPWTGTMTVSAPTHGATVFDANAWSPMPLVHEVEAMCQSVSALPAEIDDAIMRIYITCMREKRN
ncbi:hypothetical protein HZA97_08630 [Candidatus Woesearchaeota archaeon]|nr:hypothetical protein [Candidatus Woesearchaeota archaeon]